MRVAWTKTTKGALPGRKVWRASIGEALALVEPGRDSGWWYWTVYRSRHLESGSTITCTQAKKAAEKVLKTYESSSSKHS